MKKINLFNQVKKLKLAEGQQFTICFRDDGGNLRIKQRTFASIEKYDEDFPGGVKINAKSKGKGIRSLDVHFSISPLTELILWDGWIEIDNDSILYDVQQNDGFDIRFPKYENYQSEPFRLIAEAYPDNILFQKLTAI